MFLVTGGTDGSGARLDSTEIFDPDYGSWRAGAAMPSPLKYPRAAQIDNRVFMFGRDYLFDAMRSISRSYLYMQVVRATVESSTLSWSMISPMTPTKRLG